MYTVMRSGVQVVSTGRPETLLRCWRPQDGDEIRSASGVAIARAKQGFWIFVDDDAKLDFSADAGFSDYIVD